jgi:DNA-binding beta-propeller fold protein YncE
MKAFAKRLFPLIAFLSIFPALLCAETLSGYHVVKSYPIPGNGGWDYLTLDADAHRLYIAQETRAVVVDVNSGKVIGEVPGTAGIHGVALVPALKRGVTSNGKANTATIFDLETLKPLGQVKTGDKPDGILFDPATGYVFVFNGHGKSATVIDVAKMSVVSTIDLGADPESSASDGEGTIYVNFEDKNSIAVIDAKKMSVKATWPLPSCDGPTGLALDKATHRVFSACHSKVMDVLDTNTGRLIATLPIGARVDAAAFDPGTKLAFSSNGDGTLTVVQEESPDKLSVVENVQTQLGARTMALDPVTHTIYLFTAKFAPPAAEGGKPSIVPGTLTVLVVGK